MSTVIRFSPVAAACKELIRNIRQEHYVRVYRQLRRTPISTATAPNSLPTFDAEAIRKLAANNGTIQGS